MRVWIGPKRQYTYPDVTAVCGPPEFQDGEFDTLLNPALIVEVLSPSTESKDRNRKFAAYRRLKSLREYVLISQSEVLVEKYARDGENWIYTALDNLEDTLQLVSIDCDIPLKEIYAKVNSRNQARTTNEPFMSQAEMPKCRDGVMASRKR